MGTALAILIILMIAAFPGGMAYIVNRIMGE